MEGPEYLAKICCKRDVSLFRRAYQRFMDALTAMIAAYESSGSGRHHTEASDLALESFFTSNDVENFLRESAELLEYLESAALVELQLEMTEYLKSDALDEGGAHVTENNNYTDSRPASDETVDSDLAEERAAALAEALEQKIAELSILLDQDQTK
jgi:hypothetical protein